VIWARDEQGDVGGYLVPKGTAGFDPSRVIEGKIGKRAVLQAEVSLDEVRVPAENRAAAGGRDDRGDGVAGQAAQRT
jgi:glutaryl-CoA dehydrogenase